LSIAGPAILRLSIAEYCWPAILGRVLLDPAILGLSIAEYGRVVPDCQIHRITCDFSREGLKSSNFTYDYSREGCKSVKTILLLHQEKSMVFDMYVHPSNVKSLFFLEC